MTVLYDKQILLFWIIKGKLSLREWSLSPFWLFSGRLSLSAFLITLPPSLASQQLCTVSPHKFYLQDVFFWFISSASAREKYLLLWDRVIGTEPSRESRILCYTQVPSPDGECSHYELQARTNKTNNTKTQTYISEVPFAL